MTTMFARQHELLEQISPFGLTGVVTGVAGLTVTADDLPVPVGSQCQIVRRTGRPLLGEVVGFKDSQTVIMPYDELVGVARGDRVRCTSSLQHVPVGMSMLGRVLDGFGQPVDGLGEICPQDYYPLTNAAPSATTRKRITEPLGTGIRVIDSLLTCGKGQRMGIFAGPGVGKSILLGMIARYTSADVIVIGLVGERGKEVRDFLDRDLTEEGRKRAVVVVSTSDQSPVLRIRATMAATSIAEYYRDQGLNVLLLVDSLTRLAMAQRQIGLAAGEPPATKGYTPSVFAMLPKLLERAGQSDQGSITGFYTVLVEGDDITEPVSDAVRGILDGHVWLSRSLANRGHYPAISVLESVSRVMPDVVDSPHRDVASRIKRLIAIFNDVEDLVNIGAYVPGSNPEIDLAVRTHPAIDNFVRQGMRDRVLFGQAKKALLELNAKIDQEAQNAHGKRSGSAQPAGKE
ncbi:MAG: FliI/YscN family ATPase [Phycisphaerae bacterium]|nr:FliI/YscN family ATPase [Phycisphaerae bacterium]